MVRIVDVIPPEVVSSKEFADAINANCSFRTDYGRILDQAEIATLLIVRLQKQVNELSARLERMEGKTNDY